ncbi:YbaK/EbsC family protein [Salinactinospora qingdaonensis]|uniref:YbaK/EbsC family protein n=1 Tax=Salinactinospora qingdaonensis TaxID=702744 RepID=A0ABP7GJZ5_9ACTN
MWKLVTHPVSQRTDLVAPPVAAALAAWPGPTPVDKLFVAEIDPELADTANCAAAYAVPMEASANCVVISGKRGGTTTMAACVVLATTRADVNGTVRKRLGARKASFAPQQEAVEVTGMEYGGITPVGLPADWPLLVDAAVIDQPYVLIGSGLRRSKLAVPGAVLAELPNAEVVKDLAQPVE